MVANIETMFYVGDMPWHKEGIPLNEPPNTIAAINNAGLNWGVSKVNIYAEGAGLINDYYGIMRTDNAKVLGVVKKGYVPLQNSEAFNYFDPLINSKFIEYETAGALGEGEIIWILAKVKQNGTFNVNKNDEVNKYLLLSNSHDGQSAVSIKFTPIRVVCQNTLSIALNKGETTRIKHITNMPAKLEDAQVAIENICKIYSGIEELFNKMAAYKMTKDSVKEYFNRLYPVIDEKLVTTDSQFIKRNINISIQQQLLKNFNEGFGVKELGIGGTLWAAFNAVTQYIDHPLDYKLGNNKLLKRIWFGEGEIIKKKAYMTALDYIKAA
jgi:phage/plasmid-like protein (TIGR03299 family)